MARLLGGFWSTLDLVPNAVIALTVVLGAVAVSHHALTIGGLVAFITLALQLVWPVEALGYVLASGEEAATAAQRVLEIFDTGPAIASKPAAEDGQERPERAADPASAAAPCRGTVAARAEHAPFGSTMSLSLTRAAAGRCCGT